LQLVHRRSFKSGQILLLSLTRLLECLGQIKDLIRLAKSRKITMASHDEVSTNGFGWVLHRRGTLPKDSVLQQ
jgi:hypothetical protein